ncbi:MAG: PEP-CTERM sorting domain-containing protein [Sedimentisphaerales bacterium]
MKIRQILLSAIIPFSLTLSNISAANSYNITWLTQQNSGYYAINDSDQVVGMSGRCAFLWDKGVTTNLGTLPGGDYSWAEGINNSGQIIGGSYLNGTGGPHGFLWENGLMIDIGGNEGTGINNLGQVIVDLELGGNDFIWQNGQVTYVGDIGRTRKINDVGDIIGYDESGPHQSPVGFLLTNGNKTMLGIQNIPYAVNNNRQVVGQAGSNAFIWDGVNGIRILDSQYSIAYGINDNGQVVGLTEGINGMRAFIWENGLLTDLNSFIPQSSNCVLEVAYGINSRGDIVGCGYIDGTYHPYILTIVPEPATLLLLGLGAMILRKKQ